MPSVKFVRQTFPSRMVAGMTVAVMSRQEKHVEIAKLKTENKSVSSFKSASYLQLQQQNTK